MGMVSRGLSSFHRRGPGFGPAVWLAAALLTWPAGAGAGDLALPPGGVLDFSIVRKGEVIGHYHSEFVRQGVADLEVRTRVKAELSVGPVKVYRFDHTSIETWRNGRLVGLVADTDDDGQVHHLLVRDGGAALNLTVDGKMETTAADSVPSSLWSLGMVASDRPIFDITDGQLFKTSTRCTPQAMPPAEGQATVCEITGDLTRTLHYDPRGVLEGVSFLADDGSKVDYRSQ